MTWSKWVAPLVLVGMLTACQTTKRPDDAKAPAKPTGAPFQPASYASQIRHETNTVYATLFTPESYAVWVAPDVVTLKEEQAVDAGEEISPRDATMATDIVSDFIVIECHVESAFSDTSIAYDVVGFRNMSLYLLLPDGSKIPPIQTIISSKLEEDQQGTLKAFRRQNVVVFPKQNIWKNAPVLDAGAPSVRLVLEGFNSVHYFEWAGVPAPPAPPAELTPQEAAKLVKLRFKDLYSRIQALGQIFQ